jgi:hypothetical protein
LGSQQASAASQPSPLETGGGGPGVGP